MIFFLKYWKQISAIALAVGLFFSGWFINGWRIESNQQEEIIAAQEKAKLKSETLIKEKDDAIQSLLNQRDDFSNKLTIALRELHNRKKRMSDDARASCKGVSGAELADRDAEFLIRYAYRASIQQSERDACYRLYNKAREVINNN